MLELIDQECQHFESRVLIEGRGFDHFVHGGRFGKVLGVDEHNLVLLRACLENFVQKKACSAAGIFLAGVVVLTLNLWAWGLDFYDQNFAFARNCERLKGFEASEI